MSKGFTLIELVVVTGIIVLMTALTLPNYRSSNNQLALQRSAHKMAQDLRRVQEYAISAKELDEGSVPYGYGVYFNLDQPALYILFADLDGDQAYSDSGEKVEEIELETNVFLNKLEPVTLDSSLTILFIPPDPSIVFYPDAASSVINLQVQGAEEVIQYAYSRWGGDLIGWRPPHAACDEYPDTNIVDCPDNFTAFASDPGTVYDWFWQRPFGQVSRKFIKTESHVAAPGKSVEVNQAGLIAVE